MQKIAADEFIEAYTGANTLWMWWEVCTGGVLGGWSREPCSVFISEYNVSYKLKLFWLTFVHCRIDTDFHYCWRHLSCVWFIEVKNCTVSYRRILPRGWVTILLFHFFWNVFLFPFNASNWKFLIFTKKMNKMMTTYICGWSNVRHSLLVLKYKLPTVFAVKESTLFKQSWNIFSHSQLDLGDTIRSSSWWLSRSGSLLNSWLTLS